MFTKDLAIFGTCAAAAIRNRPDGDHEELILTAFVIPLPSPPPWLPHHRPSLSYGAAAVPLSLPDSFPDLHYEDYAFMNTYPPTHTSRLAVARQKSYISRRGIRRREILKREERTGGGPETARGETPWRRKTSESAFAYNVR